MKFLIIFLLLLLLIAIESKKDKATKKKEGTKQEATKKKEAVKEKVAKKKDDTKEKATELKEDIKKKSVKKEEGSKKKTKKNPHFAFDGRSEWGDKSLKKCFEPDPLKEDYLCYKYFRNYEVVYLDPVDTNPIIMIYRRLIPKEFIDEFLLDVEYKQKRKAEKKQEEDFIAKYMTSRRVANETIIVHKARKGVARVFNRIQSLIPMLNFELSGPWQVLSYKEGGHHAPHYDYITYSSPDQYSRVTRKEGNRFVTFAITLKAADIGGETVFVLSNHTVTLEAGDALLFTNIDKNMRPAPGAAHAECPVQKGEKITATLWLRPRGQELFYSHPQEEGLFAFDIEKLVTPNMKWYFKSPIYDFYIYQQMMMESFAQQFAQQEAAKKKKNPFF
ncbi:unnamed protein product [Cylicocyclus nassatus]|uniref:Fe2OG dioxygenase domain-containing protein n=1 Tax=Cylicocyclus nassatus TaxID=53992 RepID=A0AA36DLG3_CYLNA|nr:unnamed protein product [Cylicocyclus nassatus]